MSLAYFCFTCCLIYNSAVKNASGRSDVHDAKDAIEAYKNITDMINAAEAAANEAKDAADNALKVSHRPDVFYINLYGVLFGMMCC